MEVYVSTVGERKFLVLGDSYAIPIDQIADIDLHAKNGGASENSVTILLSTGEEYTYAYGNADSIRDFLRNNRITE